MRNPTHVILSLVAVASLAACFSNTSGETAAQGTEQQLQSLALKCSYGTASFDLSAATDGASHGKLSIGAQSTDWSCVTAPTDGSAPSDVVATCTERPQTLHPGQWQFVVTKDAAVYVATLKRGGTNADVAFACDTDSTVDAGSATDASSVDAGSSTAPAYSDVAPLISAACTECHGNALDSVAKLKANKSVMLRVITSGAMPRNNPGWKDTAAGKAVLDYLQHSPDLQ